MSNHDKDLGARARAAGNRLGSLWEQQGAPLMNKLSVRSPSTAKGVGHLAEFGWENALPPFEALGCVSIHSSCVFCAGSSRPGVFKHQPLCLQMAHFACNGAAASLGCHFYPCLGAFRAVVSRLQNTGQGEPEWIRVANLMV